MSTTHQEQAFTLIETLIALAIITILAAISTPQFYEYKNRSNDAQALSDAKNSIQLMTANLAR